MEFVRTVAGLMAVSAAQAADLPVKAKAVEYVKVCSPFGAGFFFIPGTDTCIKLGGYMRADITFERRRSRPAGVERRSRRADRYVDDFVSRSRMALTVDTRTATEYGAVRTFGSGQIPVHHPGQQQHQPEHFNESPDRQPKRALIRPAKAMSRWNIPSSSSRDSPSASRRRPTRRPGRVSGQQLVRSCWAATAAIPASTTSSTRRSSATACPAPSALTIRGVGSHRGLQSVACARCDVGGSNAYAGVHAPEVVGNIRVDQAWGLLQISGAAHEVNGSYNILNTAGAPAGATGLRVRRRMSCRKSPAIPTPNGAARSWPPCRSRISRPAPPTTSRWMRATPRVRPKRDRH